MKKYLLLLLLVVSFSLSCKSLPVLKPINNLKEQINFNPFLKTKYRLTHTIRVILPSNEKLIAIGITLADPVTQSVDAVLMTVEGFVLFDASFENSKLVINRTVPPFDSNDFAGTLISDIKLIYFLPSGAVWL